MLSFPGSLKVWVALEPCDMRKGFNGLHTLVGERLGEDLRAGALFVFSNRRHNRLKILYWDGTGIWVMTKTHASHCTDWKFFTNTLSAPPALRPGDRSIRCCWRA
jgi:transposase